MAANGISQLATFNLQLATSIKLFFFKVFGLHLGDEFLREIVQGHGQDAQVMHEIVIAKHGGNGDQQTGDEGSADAQ